MSVAGADPLGEMIQARAWSEASAEVQARLVRAETPAKRSFYFLFLANLAKRMIIEARRARDAEEIVFRVEEAQRWHECAAREAPRDAEGRMAFAAFLLKHRRDAAAALALLSPFSPEDASPKGDMDWLEHRRLAMRGASLVLTGQTDEGTCALFEAYGEPFSARLRSADKAPLWHIAIGGATLGEPTVERLIDDLRRFPMANERNLGKLRPALLKGDPHAYLEG